MKLFYFHVAGDVPQGVNPETAVVIDVLRATTTIAWALHNGAEAIETFSDLEKLKLGVSLFNENEESLNGIRKKTDRINLYLFKEIIDNNDSSLSFTTFVQPSINEFSDDYKYTFSASYKILISEKFSIKFKLSESYDSDPPDSAEESDQAFITSFNYSFQF